MVFVTVAKRRLSCPFWDRYPSSAGPCQIEGASTPREESMNGHLAHVRDNGGFMITVIYFTEGTLFITLNSSIPDMERFPQATPYQCL